MSQSTQCLGSVVHLAMFLLYSRLLHFFKVLQGFNNSYFWSGKGSHGWGCQVPTWEPQCCRWILRLFHSQRQKWRQLMIKCTTAEDRECWFALVPIGRFLLLGAKNPFTNLLEESFFEQIGGLCNSTWFDFHLLLF